MSGTDPGHAWPARPSAAGDGAGPGFTLLEVIVALLIFALAFGGFARILQTGLRQSGTATATTTATLIARSQLARVGAELPIETTDIEGETEDGFRWRTTISPSGQVIEGVEVELFLVEVTVGWGPPESARDLTLTSLRLGVQPEP